MLTITWLTSKCVMKKIETGRFYRIGKLALKQLIFHLNKYNLDVRHIEGRTSSLVTALRSRVVELVRASELCS